MKIPLIAALGALAMLSGGLAGVSASGTPAAPRGAGPVAGSPPAQADFFATDERLAQEVEVAFEDRPLSAVLSSVASRTGVPLTAGRETAADRIILLLNPRPAREVLSLLAGHLRSRWRRVGSGYRLEESPKYLSEVRALPERELQAVRNWMDRLSQAERIPEGHLRARQEHIRQELQSLGPRSERQASLEAEDDLLRDLLQHRTAVPVAAALFRSLTGPQARQLQADGYLRLAAPYGRLHPRWMPVIQRALSGDGSEGAPQGAEITFRLDWAHADPRRRLGPGRLRLHVQLAALTVTQGGTSHASVVEWTPSVPPLDPAPPAPHREEYPELERRVELRLPKPGHALTVDTAGPLALAGWPVNRATVGEIAAELHRTTGLEVVADGFTRARVETRLLSGRRTVWDLLETVARELGYTWKMEGGVLQLRSRYRANDRACELPTRLLTAFRERIARRPALSLDDVADLTAALTDAQCWSLEQLWGWYLEGSSTAPPRSPGGLYAERRHLRLWAMLTPAQKHTARGGILPVEQMTPPQRRAYVLTLSSPGDDLSREDLLRIPPPELLWGEPGGFRVSAREMESWAVVNEDGSYSTREGPAGPRPDERLSVSTSTGHITQLHEVGPSVPIAESAFTYFLARGPNPGEGVRSVAFRILTPQVTQ